MVIDPREHYIASTKGGYGGGAGPRETFGQHLEQPPQPEPSLPVLTEQEKELAQNEEIVRQLAALEASNEKYEKSWEGQQLKKQGILPGSKEWINRFGMPHIVATSWESEQPLTSSTPGMEGNYLYTGLGKKLMDLRKTSGQDLDAEAYGTAKETYWDDRTAQEERTRSLDQGQGGWGSGGGGGGGGGGTGYYGDPRTGNPIDRYGNFYTPQANLQQAMVNVHGTPTGFRGPGQSGFQMKRGGIVSLLRLS